MAIASRREYAACAMMLFGDSAALRVQRSRMARARRSAWMVACLAALPLQPSCAAATISAEAVSAVADCPIRVERDVAYGANHRLQRLDAYLQVGELPSPVLIEIHGGGFRRGAKSQGDSGSERFLDRRGIVARALRAGISVVSIDYRLTPGHRFPDQVEDATRAVQFVRSKAQEWRIDPQRIALCGSSAGGHLALWVGLHGDMAEPTAEDTIKRQSSRVRAVIAMSAPADFSRFDPRTLRGSRRRLTGLLLDFLSCTPRGFIEDPACRARVREASPIHLASADDPPVMLVYHDPRGRPTGKPPAFVDNPHSVWFGVWMSDALRSCGAPVKELIGRRVSRSADAAQVVAFLKEQLAPE